MPIAVKSRNLSKQTVQSSGRPAPTAQKRINQNDPVAKLNQIKDWVGTCVVGREELVRSIILAVTARSNCLFIGPPGTAKTYVVDLVCKAFAENDGDVFHTLLTKFSKRDEVMGPPDITALESGEIKYRTKGFLPAAKVGVLDEIFKGSAAILNSLLTIANERRFQNGAEWEKTPTRMLVGMSNEFPEEPALLAAFFDRFPIKLMVKYLDKDQFSSMLQMDLVPSPPPCTITHENFMEIDALVAAVQVTPEIVKSLTEIRTNLESVSVRISDRRWKQALWIMRANAVLDGRAQLVRKDLRVLTMVCWNREEDQVQVQKMLPDFENPFERELRNITDEVYAEREKLLTALNVGAVKDTARSSPDNATGMTESAKCIGRINMIGAKLEAIEDMVESDGDAALLASARASIAKITELTTMICRGRDVANALLETKEQDI